MAYETGVPTSATDILQRLVTFLSANGWTNNLSAADTNGWRAHLSRGGIFVNLRSTIGAFNPWAHPVNTTNAANCALHVYLSDSFDALQGWNAQGTGPRGIAHPAANTGCSLPMSSGAATGYHFFASADQNHVVVVVERSPGNFAHLGFGVSIEKSGAFTGGPYFFGTTHAYSFAIASATDAGSYTGPTSTAPFAHGDSPGGFFLPNVYVRADVDAFSGWVGVTSQPTSSEGVTGKNASSPLKVTSAAPPTDIPFVDNWRKRTVSDLSGQINPWPAHLFVKRDAGGSSLLGGVPHVFWTNATTRGYSAKDVYLIGADNYMLFPNFMLKKD